MLQKIMKDVLRRAQGLKKPNFDYLHFRLWHGHAPEAIAILQGVLYAPSLLDLWKSKAALTLAVWSSNELEHDKALAYLKHCRFDGLGISGRKKALRVISEAAISSGDIQTDLDLALKSEQTKGINASLCRANAKRFHEADDEQGPLGVLNRIYAKHGLAKLVLRDPAAPLSLDNLTHNGSAKLYHDQSDLVTVIMPAFNAEFTIATALRGVQEQTYENIEIIVVDDGSNDATADIVSDTAQADNRVRYVRLDVNRGTYPARNAAFKHSSGDLITVHDADDWMHPNRIEFQVHKLHQSLAIYNFTMWVRVDEHLNFRYQDGPSANLIAPDHSSALFRRDFLEEAGPWDNVRVSADTEMLWRIERLIGNKANLKNRRRLLPHCPLGLGRHRDGSLTQIQATRLSSMFFGVRREYRDAAQHWHQTMVKPKAIETAANCNSFFPCPAIIRSAGSGERTYDSIIVSDFSTETAESEFCNALSTWTESEQETAIIHVPDFRTTRNMPESVSIIPTIRECCVKTETDILVCGIPYFADSLVFVGDHWPYRLTDPITVECSRVTILQANGVSKSEVGHESMQAFDNNFNVGSADLTFEQGGWRELASLLQRKGY